MSFNQFGNEEDSPPAEGRQPKADGVGIVCSINNQSIYRNFIPNLPKNPKLSKLAASKRKAGILSEVLFWQQVHKKKFHALDFDRQRVIGNYIVDFYVKSIGLVIEIDGSSHDEKVEYDAMRQQYLENLGIRVYRITDIDVKKNLGYEMKRLEEYIVREFGGVGTPRQPSADTPLGEGNSSFASVGAKAEKFNRKSKLD